MKHFHIISLVIKHCMYNMKCAIQIKVLLYLSVTFFVFSISQDSMNALAHDLNYPALRKNKNIEGFLNRCKIYSMFFWLCECGESHDSPLWPNMYNFNLSLSTKSNLEMMKSMTYKTRKSFSFCHRSHAADSGQYTVVLSRKVTDEIRNKCINTSVIFWWNIVIIIGCYLALTYCKVKIFLKFK